MLAAMPTMQVTAVTSSNGNAPCPDGLLSVAEQDYPVLPNAAGILTPDEKRRQELADAAVGYAKNGWRVIPLCWVGEDGGCGYDQSVSNSGHHNCASPGKIPCHSGWQKPDLLSGEADAQWWRLVGPEDGMFPGNWKPEANIGILTGQVSGIFVVDIDPDNGGDLTWEKITKGRQLPLTYITQTGSGGRHWYFRYPEGFKVRNAKPWGNDAGIDIRGDGGQVVAPPSVSHKGSYRVIQDVPVAEPPAWLLDKLRQKNGRQSGAPARAGSPAVVPDETKRKSYGEAALTREAARVRAAGQGDRNDTLNKAAFSLGTLAESCQLGEHRAYAVLLDAAQAAGLGEPEISRTFLSGWSKGLEKHREPEWHASVASNSKGALQRIDVANPAKAGAWLRQEMGRGELSGLFIRDGGLVHTPRMGEDGYIDPTPAEKTRRVDHGPAQIRPVKANHVKAQVAVSYDVVVMVKDEDGKEFPIQAFFPREAAQDSVHAAELGIGCPNLETLHGVTHTPIMRRDGSILETPGYDRATGLLYLPDRDLTVPPIPENPSREQVKAAVELLREPVAQFPFVKDHHRANWLGMMISPLLREMLPGPYQMGVITAPNSGSGKSYLAGLIRIVHGMVMRGEMPREREEMRKTLISTLLTTTAPVVLFDNVRGEIYSSELEALLTSETLADRVLGESRIVSAHNDRLWLVTGNNAKVGGDMARRLLEVHIDPKCSDPSARTFDIPDLMGWMEQRRGAYIAALLTVARGWMLAGAPCEIDRSDNFARWRGSLRGLLRWAGVDGLFGDTDDSDTAAVSEEISEWHDFLEALQAAFGKENFESRDVAAALRAMEGLRAMEVSGVVGKATDDSGVRKVDPAALPGPLEEAWEKAARTYGYGSFTRSLGKWMGNRDGRFTMGLAVRTIPTSGKKSAKFVIEAEDTPDA